MTTHKILSLLISKMEELLTANSGLWVNRWVFTTVISLNLSIPNPRLVSPCAAAEWEHELFVVQELHLYIILFVFFFCLHLTLASSSVPPTFCMSSTTSMSLYLPTHTGHFFISYTLLILSALFLCGVASYIEMKSFSNLLLSSREL